MKENIFFIRDESMEEEVNLFDEEIKSDPIEGAEINPMTGRAIRGTRIINKTKVSKFELDKLLCQF